MKTNLTIAVRLGIILLSLFITGLGLFGVIAQSRLIENFGAGLNSSFHWLLLFLIAKITGAWLSGGREAWKKQQVVRSFRMAWQHVIPRRADSKVSKSDHLLTGLVYDKIPALTESRLNELQSFSFSAAVLCLFLYKVISQQMNGSLVWLLLLVLFTIVGNNIFKSQYANSLKNVQKSRVLAGEWISFFLQSSREVHWNANWNLNPEKSEKILHQEGLAIEKTLNRHVNLFLKREIIGSIFSDWPYIFGMAGVLVLGVRGEIKIAEAILWLGLIDYTIQAVQVFRNGLNIRIKRKSLETIILEEQKLFEMTEARIDLPTSMNDSWSFHLSDGTLINLSLKPGVHEITGANGSGKSMLIKSLLGHTDNYLRWNANDIHSFRDALKGRVKVIDKDAILVPHCDSFLFQISLSQTVPTQPLEFDLIARFQAAFPVPLAKQWAHKVIALEKKWNLREVKQLSSGESVLLSFARAFYFWDHEVKLLVLDEPELFFDSESQSLMNETLQFLSQKIAIFRIRHTEKMKKTFVTEGALVGVKENGEGKVFPFFLQAKTAGSGKIEVTSSDQNAIVPVFKSSLLGLIHTFPECSSLLGYDYTLDLRPWSFKLREVRSAGLAAAIAFINIYRLNRGHPVPTDFLATGEVLLDGSVVTVDSIEAKFLAAKNQNKLFISPNLIKHLIELPSVLKSMKAAEMQTR